MNILPLPAIDGIATVDWELAGNVSANLSVARTLQREVLDGDHWAAQLRFPPTVDDEAGVVDAWQAQARRGDRWLYLSPPQNELRGAWALPDLVSNGTFLGGATTGWTGTGATLSVNARRLKVKNSGAAIGYARQTLAVTADVPYVLLVDLYPGTVEAWRLRLLDAADAEEHVSYYDQAGRVPIVHIPASTSLKVELGCNTAVTGDDVKFGNVTAARCLLAKDSLAVGNTLTVKGGPASTNAAIKAGQFVTIRLWNGWQMVKLVEDLDTDSAGEGTLRFEPSLRDGVLGGGPVIVHQPFARMVFREPRAVASVRPPFIHDSGVSLMEDVTPLDNEVPHDTDIIWHWDANSLGLAPTIGSGTPTIASDATDNLYFDSDGLLKVAPGNSPVFEFNPITKALKGQRIQGARTNLLLQSGWAGATSGSPGGAPTSWALGFGTGAVTTVSASIYGALDAAQAVKFDCDSGERIFFNQTVNVTAGNTYAISAYFEAVSGSIGDGIAVNLGTATGSVTQSVTDPTAGRQTLLFSCTGTGTLSVRVGVGCNAVVAGTASATISRPQCEAGAFATSYIPTTTASVARDSDVDTMATSAIAWFNPSAITLSGEFIAGDRDTTTTQQAVTLNDGTDDNAIRFTQDSSGVNYFVVVRSAAANQAAMSLGDPVEGAVQRVAGAMALDNFVAARNGAAVVTDVSGSMPAAITTLRKGAFSASAGFLNSYLRRLTLFKVKKPNRQVRSLSA